MFFMWGVFNVKEFRLVMDELQMEQRAQTRRNESKKQMERNLMAEMERLQRDLELAKQSTEVHHLTAESLKKEVSIQELVNRLHVFL